MDISDVAYNAFLANGRRSIHLPGKPGETVRLRFINAGASTYFYLQSSTGPLRIVAADGPAVQPIHVKRLLVGMAETYDVIVTPTDDRAYTLVAEANDRSGMARATLAPRAGMAAEVPPLRERPLATMQDMGMGGMNMSGGSMAGMDHSGMDHSFLSSTITYGMMRLRYQTLKIINSEKHT